MKTIQKGNHIFCVDIEKTKKYYQQNTPCNCCNCRNFYAQIRTQSPLLTDFLAEFGIDICRPDEVPSVEMDNYIDYLFAGYTVVGNIDADTPYETDLENYHIRICKGDTPYDCFPNEQRKPHFFVSVSGISLPWVLDEPFPRPEKFIDQIKRLFKKQP